MHKWFLLVALLVVGAPVAQAAEDTRWSQTEALARGAGSTIDGMLPVAKHLNVAMYNGGLVDGKTQTRFPWNWRERPYTQKPPTLWFHDLLHGDGTPYRTREIQIIQALIQAAKHEVPDL